MVGMIERAEGKYFDDAVLFRPEGDLNVYRKTHLFGPERAVFTPGDQPVVVETALGRLGLSVCYDLMFPEFIRSLVLNRAQVVLNATDWISDVWQSSLGWGGDTVSALARIRALEKGVHAAIADRAGVEAGWRNLGRSDCRVSDRTGLGDARRGRGRRHGDDRHCECRFRPLVRARNVCPGPSTRAL